MYEYQVCSAPFASGPSLPCVFEQYIPTSNYQVRVLSTVYNNCNTSPVSLNSINSKIPTLYTWTV